MSTFLLVPGAWLGGWCWRYVASDLRAAGHKVIPATLTGLGERAHLLSRDIDLETHISDIVGLFEYRDLHNVVLVGHSYGGIVITGVAERVPDRIQRLVYLDASVPCDGESNDDVIGPVMAAQLRASAVSEGDGWKVPPASYVIERLSGHPSAWYSGSGSRASSDARTSSTSISTLPPLPVSAWPMIEGSRSLMALPSVHALAHKTGTGLYRRLSSPEGSSQRAACRQTPRLDRARRRPRISGRHYQRERCAQM
jgi:pimeloyl-ACP methyl ester carboxylesterase